MPGAGPAADAADILLVEDNPDDAFLTRIEFEDAGLTNPLVVVEDGEDALLYLRRQGKFADATGPCLVLLDLHLPRIDGPEVLEEVERDAALRAAPIVVVSAPTELGWVEERFADVIVGVLPKPVEVPALTALITEQLGLDVLRVGGSV